MGNLFGRGVQPLDLEKMKFYRLTYWNSWHLEMKKAEDKQANEIEKKTGKK